VRLLKQRMVGAAQPGASVAQWPAPSAHA
jgi:hypothetical protein